MKEPKREQTQGCEIANIWEVLGRRWTLLILKNFCTKEVIRFNELKRSLSGISSTVLSDRLLDLEREGLLSKKIYPEIPPKVEYRMTPQARELESIINELRKWADRWKSPQLQKA
ncbi:MAG: helix-turn-helix domain-containing protein [Nitrososphaeraceae archaeon]